MYRNAKIKMENDGVKFKIVGRKWQLVYLCRDIVPVPIHVPIHYFLFNKNYEV